MALTKKKNEDFELIAEYAKPDVKNRLSLGGARVAQGAMSGVAFNIYKNALGELLLVPVKAVPVTESWLWENPAALASVKKGLQQSDRRLTHDLGDFSKFAKG